MEKLKYTFKNGSIFYGTFNELKEISKIYKEKIENDKIEIIELGPDLYLSESKGLIKISEMNEYHARRTLIKVSKKYLDDVYDEKDTNTEFLNKFFNISENKTVQSLVKHLSQIEKYTK